MLLTGAPSLLKDPGPQPRASLRYEAPEGFKVFIKNLM